MSLELTVDGFGWIKSTYFLEEFIKDYNEKSLSKIIMKTLMIDVYLKLTLN